MKKFLFVLVALALLAVPLTASAATITYAASFQLQNLSSSTATVVIDFYDQNGGTPAGSQVTTTIGPNAQVNFYTLSSLPTPFNGSAVVSSDQPLASITNVLGNNAQRGDSYTGFVAGAMGMNLPVVMKSNYGNNTWFNIQNTGTSPATVHVHYAGSAPGSPNVSCDEPVATIAPNAAKTYDQATGAPTCMPADRFVGAATVTSDQPVAAVVMEVGSDVPAKPNLLSYTGFTPTDAAIKPVMPLIMSKNYNNYTSINLMNTGANPTDITISYTPLPGNGSPCSETQTVAAGKMGVFGYPNMPGACGTGTWIGSAAVTGNSASMPLVAVVNQTNSANANASAYNAFNPANAKTNVSLPLIMDRNYGLYTSVAVVNMGTQATDVKCTFSGGTSYQINAPGLAPGAMYNELQSGRVGAGYVGSGTCTATNGDHMIAALVNQVMDPKYSTYSTGADKLFTYPGFGY